MFVPVGDGFVNDRIRRVHTLRYIIRLLRRQAGELSEDETLTQMSSGEIRDDVESE